MPQIIELCLILLGSLILMGAVCYGLSRWRGDKMQDVQPAENRHIDNPDECCGMHEVCEKTTANAIAQKIVYYDDDELDMYAGRGAEDYTDTEIEQFRDVLITLQPHDAPGWSQSLQLRGISLPAPLADELQLLIAEI